MTDDRAGSGSAAKRAERSRGSAFIRLARATSRRRVRSRRLATAEASRPISSQSSSRLAADESRTDRENEGGGNFAGFASDRREAGFFPAPRTRNGGAGHEQEPEEQGEDGVAPHRSVRVTRACASVVENDDPRPRGGVFFSGRTRVLSTLIGAAGRDGARHAEVCFSVKCRVVRCFARNVSSKRRFERRDAQSRGQRSHAGVPPTRAGGVEQVSPLPVARRLAPGAPRTR